MKLLQGTAGIKRYYSVISYLVSSYIFGEGENLTVNNSFQLCLIFIMNNVCYLFELHLSTHFVDLRAVLKFCMSLGS